MEDGTYDLVYYWGLVTNRQDEPERWFVRVDAEETDYYAAAYFELDDSEPVRTFETNAHSLLRRLMDALDTELYEQCQAEKNFYLQFRGELDSIPTI